MRPNDFDASLYDAGVHTLIDSVSDPLVALQDQDALDALVGYLTVFLAQAGSLGLVANREALQAFVLHAQRVGEIGVEFLVSSFEPSVRGQVPASPPIAPPDLFLADAGSGVVNASCSLGVNADRYELWWLDGSAWEKVADGIVDGSVNFQVSGVSPGTHSYRVIARIGFFASFPGDSEEVIVA